MLFLVQAKWQWKLKNDQQTAEKLYVCRCVSLKRVVVLGEFFAAEDNKT